MPYLGIRLCAAQLLGLLQAVPAAYLVKLSQSQDKIRHLRDFVKPRSADKRCEARSLSGYQPAVYPANKPSSQATRGAVHPTPASVQHVGPDVVAILE